MSVVDMSAVKYRARCAKADKLARAAIAQFGGDARVCARRVRYWTDADWAALAKTAGTHKPSEVTVMMVFHRLDTQVRHPSSLT